MALPDANDSGHSLVVGTDDEKRVVWILGAGFSVPLGGPLFGALISEPAAMQLEDWPEYGGPNALPHYAPKSAALVVALLYECGRVRVPASDGGPMPLSIWTDAEQFLDVLDVAHRDPGGFIAKRIKMALSMVRHHRSLGAASVTPGNPRMAAINHFTQDLGALHREAVRFVAGACSTFLLQAQNNPNFVDNSEPWAPYRRWHDTLQAGGDTVITFNYDRALNILAEYGGRCRPAKNVLVSPAWSPEDSLKSRAENTVPMLHLHGHVGWRRHTDGRTVQVEGVNGTFPDLPVAHLEPDPAVIGVPGQHKLTLPTGLLENMWQRAMTAIEEAGAVVLVGYRFPETDNMAKRRLIDALKKRPDAYAHLVLGANNQDTPRVQAMLEWTRPKERVRVHPLWAEDFFTVFERAGLFNG